MDDMPNLVQIIDHPQKPYVQSGLDRLKSSTDEPYWQWWDEPVVPIISVPVDADGDNDGVIDKYDSQSLDGNNRTLKPDDSGYDGRDTIFLSFKKDNTNGKIIILNNSNVYAFPFVNSKNLIGNIETKEIDFYGVVYSAGYYWVKIKHNGCFGYVLCKFTNLCIEYPYKYSLDTFSELLTTHPEKSEWNGEKYYSDGTWNGFGCFGFSLKVFYNIWGISAYTCYSKIDKKVYENTKFLLTKENADSFFNQLLPGTFFSFKWLPDHTIMITDIDAKNHKITVYEANIKYIDENGKEKRGVKYTQYSYVDFIEHYGMQVNGTKTVQITLCCNPYQVLQHNGVILCNNDLIA